MAPAAEAVLPGSAAALCAATHARHQVLGTPGCAEADGNAKKAHALLGYLVAAGCMHGRPHLCDLLWDGPADPRAALRSSLSKLRIGREADGATRIITERGRVGFEPSGARVDLSATRASVANHPAGAWTEALEAALVHVRAGAMCTA